MPEREIPVTLVVRTLDEELVVADPLLFSEIACCDGNADRVQLLVKALAKGAIEATPNFKLHQRLLPGEASVQTVEVTLPPPKKRPDWTEPVELTFHVIRWRHGHEAYIAFVPGLGIEIMAAREPDLKRMIPEHITSALRRSKTAESLYELALTQRTANAVLETVKIAAAIKTPRHLEQEEGKEKEQKPAIEEVGIVLNDVPKRPAFAMEAVVEQIADSLTGRNPRSVLLIGASGVGKTAAVHELVRRRNELQLGTALFWATSGSRLIAGMSGFGMWQKRCQRLCKEAARDNAILHLGNLIELMEVGRGGGGGQGIAGFLRPYLGRAEILAIAECTPEQLPLIERENPHLLDVFHQVRVEEPTPEAGREILLSRARESERVESSFGAGWLEALDRLHRRYATYSAYPGRPLRFLENLIKDRPLTEPLGPTEVIAAFSRETGLPQFMLDAEVPLDLAGARTWYAERVIGQARAVDLVTDLLATVKAALTRPRRPIASLLFIGPTGVGKTELAKSLAEYFFGDRNRLTRFDMSEFAGAMAVERLAGGTFGAEGLLTAKVREQPFSVILFDEFEKAHWSFFDLLLQVLGEGRLTDAAGRLGDFSNAIVIMTSNLGAEAFGKGTFGLARGGGYADPTLHFTDEVRAFLRPELFNRIDRVVPFLPLDSATIRQIADREIALLNKRDGIRLRSLSLDLSADARQYLTDKGYDLRYGARPLKRAIERELLAPLAASVNTYTLQVKLEAIAEVRQGKFDVVVRAQLDAAGRAMSVATSASDLAVLATACMNFRRDAQRLERCSPFLAVLNQLFLLQREEGRKVKRGKAVYDAARAEQIRELKEIADPADALRISTNELEDDILSALYGSEGSDRQKFHMRLAPLRSELYDILLMLLARQTLRPHKVTVAIFGDREKLWDLARAYHAIAGTEGCTTRLFWFSRFGPEHLKRHPCYDPAKFLPDPDEKAIGVAIGISGRYASLKFSPEAGIHSFIAAGKEMLCMVDTSDEAVSDYEPPPRVEFPENPSGDARRQYKLDAGTATDSVVNEKVSWAGRGIEPAVAEAMTKQLAQAIWGVLSQ